MMTEGKNPCLGGKSFNRTAQLRDDALLVQTTFNLLQELTFELRPYISVTTPDNSIIRS